MINKPFQKGMALAQTIVHVFMLCFLYLKSTMVFPALAIYSVFALIQYGIVTTYSINIQRSITKDIVFTVLSLTFLYLTREFVGTRFISNEDMFLPDAPFLADDHLFTWGLGFYVLTRIMGVGYGLCFSRVKPKKHYVH